MSQATDVLRHEHDAILLVLKILDKISDEVSVGKREFSDTCHYGKEEGLLFPAIIEAGRPASGARSQKCCRIMKRIGHSLL